MDGGVEPDLDSKNNGETEDNVENNMPRDLPSSSGPFMTGEGDKEDDDDSEADSHANNFFVQQN